MERRRAGGQAGRRSVLCGSRGRMASDCHDRNSVASVGQKGDSCTAVQCFCRRFVELRHGQDPPDLRAQNQRTEPSSYVRLSNSPKLPIWHSFLYGVPGYAFDWAPVKGDRGPVFVAREVRLPRLTRFAGMLMRGIRGGRWASERVMLGRSWSWEGIRLRGRRAMFSKGSRCRYIRTYRYYVHTVTCMYSRVCTYRRVRSSNIQNFSLQPFQVPGLSRLRKLQSMFVCFTFSLCCPARPWSFRFGMHETKHHRSLFESKTASPRDYLSLPLHRHIIG